MYFDPSGLNPILFHRKLNLAVIAALSRHIDVVSLTAHDDINIIICI